MGLDDDVYENATTYNPDRFIDEDGTLRKALLPHGVFGFGRR